MRTADDLRRHFEIEQALASRLLAAPPEDRSRLYSQLYDELFRRVPDHPQINPDPDEHAFWISAQLRTLRRIVRDGDVFLEIGAGDCAMAAAIAARASRVIAIDVSNQIPRAERMPDNLELVISDGRTIPVEPGSVDVAYSNQLMEHLHPEDARDQLANVARALRPGGKYVCVTPHRFSGPHDISRGFAPEAAGFHLKEYTTTELYQLLRTAGFRRVRSFMNVKNHAIVMPVAVPLLLEAALRRLPPERRRRAARSVLRKLLGVSVIGTR